MLKKVIPIVIVLCLISGISAMAENENTDVENSAPEMSEQIPQNIEELPQGGVNRGMPPSGNMRGRTPDDMPNGEMPPEGMNRGKRPQGNFTPPQKSGEFTPPQNTVNQNTETAIPTANEDTVTENVKSQENVEQSDQPQGENQQFDGQMPAGMGGFPGNMQNFNGQTTEDAPKGFLGFVKTYSTPITSVILLGLAFIFVIFYRRKNY